MKVSNWSGRVIAPAAPPRDAAGLFFATTSSTADCHREAVTLRNCFIGSSMIPRRAEEMKAQTIRPVCAYHNMWSWRSNAKQDFTFWRSGGDGGGCVHSSPGGEFPRSSKGDHPGRRH